MRSIQIHESAGGSVDEIRKRLARLFLTDSEAIILAIRETISLKTIPTDRTVFDSMNTSMPIPDAVTAQPSDRLDGPDYPDSGDPGSAESIFVMPVSAECITLQLPVALLHVHWAVNCLISEPTIDIHLFVTSKNHVDTHRKVP